MVWESYLNGEPRGGLVPFGRALVRVRRGKDTLLFKRAADQLAANGNAARRETAGKREHGQSDIAQGTREAWIGGPEGVDGARRARGAILHGGRAERIRGDVQHVRFLERSQILAAYQLARAQRVHVLRRGDGEAGGELLPDAGCVLIRALAQPVGM